MQLEGTRFGDIDIDDGRVIEFAAGLIGFPAARRFVLLERNPNDPIAWLQSLRCFLRRYVAGFPTRLEKNSDNPKT